MEENTQQSVEKSKAKKQPREKFRITKDMILAFTAYIGIGCIAIALLLVLILKGNTKLSSIFSAIGQVIAYVICIILAFNWIRRHRHIAWIVCYVVFVVTIVVLFILTAF